MARQDKIRFGAIIHGVGEIFQVGVIQRCRAIKV